MPEPVGPVTRTIPSVLFSDFLIRFKVSTSKPNSLSPISELSFSRILRTTLSPNDDGKVDTLKSIFLWPIEIDILPSCGNLLSEISSLDIIFILLITICEILFLYFSISLNTPSIRNRIHKLFSNGSKWISDALEFIALVIVALISFIIGPSFLSSKRSSEGEIELAISSKFKLLNSSIS